MEIKSNFASSIDPTKVSLTVESLSKAVIFLVGYFAAAKGFDPATATTQAQALTDVTLSIVPACFALYHGLQAIYGITRKMFVDKGIAMTSTN